MPFKLPLNAPRFTPPVHKATRSVDWKDNETCTVRFSWSQEDVDLVKTIPGRKYLPDVKAWTVPLFERNVQTLEKKGFEIAPKVKVHFTQAKRSSSSIMAKIPGSERLFPFQREGVAQIEYLKGRALLADEMGLGKTVQAIVWASMHPELKRILCIVPASLKLNWELEFNKWWPGQSIQILSGTQADVSLSGNILIINYDVVSAWQDVLITWKPDLLITDETHKIKNGKTLRTKAVLAIAAKVPNTIALTGTPIVNRPAEGFNILKMVSPKLFPSYFQYAQRYCDPRPNPWSGGFDYNGASNTEELHKILTETVMIRRLKKDVLKDLPDKVHSPVPIEMESWEEYRQVLRGFMGERKIDALAQIEYLKQATVRGKMKGAIAWIADFIEEGDKLILMCTHHEAIDVLAKEFKGCCVVVDGRTPLPARQQAVNQFQNNPDITLFIGNINAAGVGLTLTAASAVAFLEFPWTPGDLAQAIDRAHRIGQKYTVNVYYLIAEGTIDEKIVKLLSTKMNILDQVLDGKPAAFLSILDELIEMLKNDPNVSISKEWMNRYESHKTKGN